MAGVNVKWTRRAALAGLVAVLAGCGKTVGSNGPGAHVGTLQDVENMVDTCYIRGALAPPNADVSASLLATMDVDGVMGAAAVFVSGAAFPSAGTVSVRANLPGGPADVTLYQVSTGYQGSTAYAYTSRLNHPLGLDLTFDGTAYHRFTATGSADFPAFVDSVKSVRPPAVTSPADGGTHARSADLVVLWSDVGTDSTVYVTGTLVSGSDTTKVAVSTLTRDTNASALIPASRLAALPLGSATLTLARYRLTYHTEGTTHKTGLACEAAVRRTVVLD